MQDEKKIKAEYAFRHIDRPMAAIEYETMLTKAVPEDLKSSLPTIEEIELQKEITPKTLQELEQSDWGEPKRDDTPLVKKCHQLRRIPLIEFEISNLACMIRRGIGLEYLIPIAFELLRVDSLADRDFNPGTLLRAILEAPSQYWKRNPNLREECEQIYKKTLNNKEDVDLNEWVIRELERAYFTFTEFGPLIDLLWKNTRVKKTCNCFAVQILAVIASRQPVTLERINALIGIPVSDKMIEFLSSHQLITYHDEGYPAFSLLYIQAKRNKSINPIQESIKSNERTSQRLI